MRERLVADWLTKAGERGGLDVAFGQLLLSEGCRILRLGHSPTEAGKDIIAVAKNRQLRAYQIKAGDIDLKEFESIQGQVTNLVEASIRHPSVAPGSKHFPFLVTTGKFTLPVEETVQGLNDAWRRRGYEPLTLIRGTELLPQFMELASDFWPAEPNEVRQFLTLYMAEGKGDLDRAEFSRFLRGILLEKKMSKPIVARRIATVGLFASYIMEAFHRQVDHWSTFCGWTMVAAHQAWAAEIHNLDLKNWHSSFLLSRAAALASLENLATETLAPEGLRPREPEFDDYTRMRNTIAISAVATWHLIKHRREEMPGSLDQAIPLVLQLVHKNRLWFWGESALPHFLSIFWFLEHYGQGWAGEEVILQIVSLLTRFNHGLSDLPLAGPDHLADDVFSSLLKKLRHPEPQRGRRAPVSWGLESLIHLLANRMRRQALQIRWAEITNVQMAAFVPTRVCDALLWHCDDGEETERLAAKPQSWRELTKAAKTYDLKRLPSILAQDPDFALMFSLVYPQRATTNFITALDNWFG